MAEPEDILEFWFGRPGDPDWENGRAVWFHPSLAFDGQCRARFMEDYEVARAGGRDGWRSEPRSCLALIVLLDQLPRNMFRGSARTYESDDKALAAARHAVAARHDNALRPVERSFIYLPFEHAEDLVAQHEGVALFSGLDIHPRGKEWLEFARRHMEIVARFGRFPHRNDILGRPSTPAEIAFLKEPNSTFLRPPSE